ncbi:toxin-antitoxin system TumE family protein [Methylobacterium oxalidis]|uniref:Uncharacterized protein n=1 Tax=Methylobacterium oxalidis TaxID=944322 RepID=A0A512IYP8_9HYPH|nr:DUF6516 family protein [Methylobacterium oxalidis]GEP02825.1 hypothetical protein MOX02_08630 [Methylobacterium oxalidis]GJE33812.1 hypothetical protein LDDCCGHA_4015 [Methylobacterium oxalidis]GLS66775.1 hypothetical protein GCM10007888_51580 [Methylobacterium oxalidis]
MASAILLLHDKTIFADGAILEVKLWRLAEGDVVRGSVHPFKYSLFYGRAGLRLLAYDNEAGKGDHVHRGEVEMPYAFTTPADLIEAFLAKVASLRESTG